MGHQGTKRRDIPDKNFFASGLFCCFRQGVAGMSRDLGRDVPDLEILYARKLGADFSYPRFRPRFKKSLAIAVAMAGALSPRPQPRNFPI